MRFSGTSYCSYCILATILLASMAAAEPSVVAQSPDGERLDRALTRLEAFGFSGSVLVAREGEVLLNRAYGLADRAEKRRATTSTRFDVGSLAKQFTATAILALEAEGRLELSDTVGGFFPKAPVEMASITLHQLLTHTSGLPRDWVGADLVAQAAARQAPPVVSRQEALEQILGSELESPPGTAAVYSNLGYVLLAAVVEEASGQSYPDFLRERLFAPAGLEHTGFWGQEGEAGEVAVGYEQRGAEHGRDPARWQDSWYDRGSGAVLSTAGDLYRWHRALLAGDVVPFPSLRHLFPDGGSAAYGWSLSYDSEGAKAFHQSGAFWGSSADFQWLVHEGLVIIVLCNQREYDLPLAIVVNRLWVPALLAGEEEPIPNAVDAGVPLAAVVDAVGSYRAVGGGAVEIFRAGDRLLIGARDQAATDLLTQRSEEELARYGQLSGRFRTAFERRLGEAVEEGGEREDLGGLERLDELLADLESRLGELESAEVLATTRGIASSREPETTVRLGFERGAETCRFLWEEEAITEMSCDQPLVAVTPLVPLSATDLVGFSLAFRREVRLELVAGEDGEVTAVRLRSPGRAIVAQREDR